MTYVRLDGHEARPVEVQMDDGLWAPGFLEAYRKVEGVGQASCATGPRLVGA